MTNARWRKINQFLATNEFAKVQTAFGVPMLNALLNFRENCEVEWEENVERGQEFNCDQRDLIAEPLKSRFMRFRFIFNRFTAQRAANYTALKEGVASAFTGTPADEIQTLTRSGTVSGGSFTYAFSYEGRSGITAPIAFDANAAQIQAAILKKASHLSLGRMFQPGDVVVTGTWGTAMSVAFGGRFAKADLPLPTINNGLITGGGSIVAAQGTAGQQNVCDITRALDGEKQLFSFALGDKNGSIATDKYFDAVVESIDFSASETEPNATMTVVVACGWLPDEQVSFSVPACVNTSSVKNKDIRLLINNVYEQRDLVSHTASFNDNVPTAAAFAFDDVDITEPFQAGDQPTQEFTDEIYGTKGANLYVLAQAEEIEGNEVPYIAKYGLPKDRLEIIADETKIKFQGTRGSFAGDLNESTVRTIGTPYGLTDIPVSYKYYGSQTTQFLLTA